MTAKPAQRDVAPAEMVDAVRARLDEARLPCPECGQPMVSARAFEPGAGAFIGLVCVPCDKLYHVEEG